MMTTDQRSQWLQDRRAGIGGSDAPAVLGLSRWKSPLQLYLDKRGESPIERAISEPMRWGTRLEPVIRQAYADATGEIVRVPEGILRHPEHAWMIGSIDGVTDSQRLVEIKAARSTEGWGDPGTDQVPEAYLIQVQHYLAVTRLEVADVAVLFGGSDFQLYEVPSDRELQAQIIDAEAAFWSRVQAGVPPEPITLADAVARWGRHAEARRALASQAVADQVAELRDLKAAISQLETTADGLQARICAAMAEADTLVDADGRILCTWKGQKGSARLDTSALKLAHPEIAAAFTRVGEPTRRFLLKSAA